MTDSSISTRVASELLSVHESSIKRWCNAGELEFWTTPGGHRRIPIGRLVAFAKERGLEGEIIHFDDLAERVWIGLDEATKNDNSRILSKLVLEWINLGRIELVERLVLFLTHQGLSVGTVFDRVLADAMGRVGSAYTSAKLSVGDEHRLTALIRDVLISIRGRIEADNLNEPNASPQTAVVGCIRGELHEIGSLMVRLILLHSGWRVVYLGQDVPTEEFHAQAKKHEASLICISMVPPRGGAEAVDAINLLAHLFGPKTSTRIAIGGSALDEVPETENLKVFPEVRYFNEASPFENWVQSLSS